MLSFRVIAFSFGKFWSWTPCIIYKLGLRGYQRSSKCPPITKRRNCKREVYMYVRNMVTSKCQSWKFFSHHNTLIFSFLTKILNWSIFKDACFLSKNQEVLLQDIMSKKWQGRQVIKRTNNLNSWEIKQVAVSLNISS